jgi:hypothetical protein
MPEEMNYQIKSCPDHDKFAADIAYLRGAVTVLIGINILSLILAGIR